MPFSEFTQYAKFSQIKLKFSNISYSEIKINLGKNKKRWEKSLHENVKMLVAADYNRELKMHEMQ